MGLIQGANDAKTVPQLAIQWGPRVIDVTPNYFQPNHQQHQLLPHLFNASKMPSPEEQFANWRGMIDTDFSQTISSTFDLPVEDNYVYRAEDFALTLAQIQEQIDSGKLKYKYQSHGQQIQVQLPNIWTSSD